MASRLQLQTLLEELLGSSNVYFQQPPSNRMQYPCILYRRNNIDTKFADNYPYAQMIRYQVIAISRDPDNPVVAKLSALPRCTYDRHYTADNLNHDSFNLYF